MRRIIIIGTRGSALARWQAEWVAAALRRAADVEVQIKPIATRGDRARDRDEATGGTGMFTKEIEQALLAGKVDLAVHSLKDLPINAPAGLTLAAVPLREDPADVLVSRHAGGIEGLPRGAAVLCGSLRRRAQLLARRPDVTVRETRGNIHTRLARFDASDAAGMILARAGLARLGLEGRISYRLDPADFLPAPGQAALAVQCRMDDGEVLGLASAIDDARGHAAAACERAVLEGLGGGCRMPVGAYARFEGHGRVLRVVALAAVPDGSRQVRDEAEDSCPDPAAAHSLGLKLAERLRSAGAGEILRGLDSSPRREDGR